MSTREKQHQGHVRNEGISCLHFDYEAVVQATKGFDTRSISRGGCKLGEGGFGPVFKGDLKFTEVAIKVLRRTQPGDKGAAELANEQFEAELKVLSRFRHPNLVMLLGYSNTPNKPRCLIYEFMANGNLEDALELGFDIKKPEDPVVKKPDNKAGLPWIVRISIALDTARGLSFLHNAIRGIPLVHRDVKSANVLLDLSFRAKVGDFGLVRAIGEDPHNQFNQSQTARIVGTSGYIAPEYYRGTITTKLDTYAFGVLLLEILTGKPSYDQRRGPSETDLVSMVETRMKKDSFSLFTLIDAKSGDWPSASFMILFDIAEKCLTPKLSDRPEMSDVYLLLDELAGNSHKLYYEQETVKEDHKTKRSSTSVVRQNEKPAAVLSNQLQPRTGRMPASLLSSKSSSYPRTTHQ